MSRPFCTHCMHMLCGEVHIPYEGALMPACKIVKAGSVEAQAYHQKQTRIKEEELIF